MPAGSSRTILKRATFLLSPSPLLPWPVMKARRARPAAKGISPSLSGSARSSKPSNNLWPEQRVYPSRCAARTTIDKSRLQPWASILSLRPFFCRRHGAFICVVMSFGLAAAIVGIAFGPAAAYPGAVWDFYKQLYPSDAPKRHALELCFPTDHKLNRLDPDQREACYRERH